MTVSRNSTEQSESTAPAQSLTVDIVHEAGNWSALDLDVDGAILTAAAAVAQAPMARVRPGMALVVALADDATVSRLNGTYRAKDKSTNVLSFPSGDAAGLMLGDIVLALETVCLEAADLRISALHHTQHLVVHGLLHLLGFAHESDADASVMERLEIEILASIGVADPYEGTEPVLADAI